MLYYLIRHKYIINTTDPRVKEVFIVASEGRGRNSVFRTRPRLVL
jgi:hypothetical protein